MTTEEIEELQAMSRDIAGVTSGPDEPLCVARCFASPLSGQTRFTMQTWIDLEAIRSPILRGESFGSAKELSAAFAAFGLQLEGLDPEEAALVEGCMRRAIETAFGMALKMHQPETTEEERSDGFGTWLLIYTCLLTECGRTLAEANGLDVGRAFAIVAALRSNQGWRPTGTPYALRGIGDGSSEMGDRAGEPETRN